MQESSSSLRVNLSPPTGVRRAQSKAPDSTSRGPHSILNGTPRFSHSKNLAPGFRLKRVSTCVRMPAFLSDAFAFSTKAISSACCSGAFSGPLGLMGTSTTWVGATAGGSTRPASSECVITSAPISRVETPLRRQFGIIRGHQEAIMAHQWPRDAPEEAIRNH